MTLNPVTDLYECSNDCGRMPPRLGGHHAEGYLAAGDNTSQVSDLRGDGGKDAGRDID